MFAEEGTVKLRNQRVAIVVVDFARQLAPGVPLYAQISGVANAHDGEESLKDALAIAYGNPGGYLFPLHEFNTIVIDVDRVTGVGPLRTATLGGWAPDADDER